MEYDIRYSQIAKPVDVTKYIIKPTDQKIYTKPCTIGTQVVEGPTVLSDHIKEDAAKFLKWERKWLDPKYNVGNPGLIPGTTF